MNLKEIKEMIQLMNENSLTEFELENEGLKVRLKKGSQGSIEQTVLYEARSAAAAQAALASASAALPQTGASKTESAVKEAARQAAATAKLTIKSPMVGTFYAAPAPDAQPFVQVGGVVEVGQVVCVMEAMKLMNEIKSEVRGKVAEILVHNGDPVEFGQPLFLLE